MDVASPPRWRTDRASSGDSRVAAAFPDPALATKLFAADGAHGDDALRAHRPSAQGEGAPP